MFLQQPLLYFLMAQYFSHFASKPKSDYFSFTTTNFKKSTQWLFPPHWYLSWTVNCLSSLLAVSLFLLVASLPTHDFASSNSEPFCMYELSSKEFLHVKCWEMKFLHVAARPHECVSSYIISGALFKVLLVARNWSFKSLPRSSSPVQDFL